MWGKIISYASKYGKKAVEWAWKHREFLISQGISMAMDYISNIFG